jgi:uncharacterized protein (DUF58 family)
VNVLLQILYRFYRVVSWMRFRATRRFTRSGWMVLMALGAAAVLGVDTENTVAYQAFAPLLCLIVAAAVFTCRFRTRLRAQRVLPRFGSVGVPLRYTVSLANPSRKCEEDLTLLENLADPRPTFAQWKAMQLADQRRVRSFRIVEQRRRAAFAPATVAPATLPPIPARGELEVQVEIIPLRRGVIQFLGLTFARPDPFGLVRAFCRQPLPQSILILPRRYALPPVALPGELKYQQGGVTLSSNIGQSDEFVSLREYRRGDPLRHIHWRSWAKTGKPIVREFEDEFFARHALVLDTFTDEPYSEVFEEAVSIAASFACTIELQESLLDLLFVGPQAYCFTAGRGLAEAEHMLEILSSVKPCTDKPFHTLEHLVLDHVAAVSGCICVLLAWDQPRRDCVKKLQALGVPLSVVVVVEEGRKQAIVAEANGDRPNRFFVLERGRVEEGLAAL